MSGATIKKRFGDYIREKYDAAKERIETNLSLVASVSALALGGLTLLFYALSIGQLPEFTWNDLTGTLLAVCATGVLVVGFSVVYCLFGGYLTGSVLESVYPQAAGDEAAASGNTHGPVAPHTRLTRGSFALGVMCLSLLAWVLIAVLVWPQQLIPPHQAHLVGALIVAAASLVILLLVDWRRFRRQVLRYGLLGMLGGALTTASLIIAAWSVAPDSMSTKAPAGFLENLPAVDWAQCGVWVLNHAILIGVSAAATVLLLINLRTIGSRVVRLVHCLAGKISSKLPHWKLPDWRWLNWVMSGVIWLARIVMRPVRFVISLARMGFRLVQVLKRMLRVIVGDAPDRRLVNAKVRVIIVFGFWTSAVYFIAFAMAGMGDAHEWIVHFIFMVLVLVSLNWALVSVRHWKERAGLGLVTAVLVFGIYPLLTHNFSMFPKMVVSLLGLGNERLASIALSSKQCATLAPYGVSCAPDNERTITLTNVNLLNRLGSSVVLELLIKGETADPQQIALSAGPNSPIAPPDRDRSPLPEKTLVATGKMGVNSPSSTFCDAVLLSSLDSSDEITAKTLRCVELVIPKDQVLGYTTARWRNYRGAYTAYQPAPAKSPMTVKVIADEPNAKDGEKAVVSAALARP